MSTSDQRRLATQLYENGQALFEQGLYREALAELQQAEQAFREIDVRGQPFPHPLSNGISGLANSLVLAGRCSQKLGDYRAAITCYETSLINGPFEKKKAFHRFVRAMKEDLTACYEQALQALSAAERERLAAGNPALDISYRFPYSLPPEAIPMARLYELAPEQHGQYRGFYERQLQRDIGLRRESRITGEEAMRKFGISVWLVLAAVLVFYVVVALRALLRQ